MNGLLDDGARPSARRLSEVDVADRSDDTPRFRDRNMVLHTRWHRAKRALDATSDPAEADRLRRRMSDIENSFVEANLGLVNKAVRRESSDVNGAWSEDVRQVVTIQMWELFPKWDPERGTFATFAQKHLSGAARKALVQLEHPMINYDDWTARPKILAAVGRLRARREDDLVAGRTPTPLSFQAIAAEAGCDVTPLAVERVLRPKTRSLDVIVGDTDKSLHDMITFDDLEDDHGEAFQVGVETADSQLEYVDVLDLAKVRSHMIERNGIDVDDELEPVGELEPLEAVVAALKHGLATGHRMHDVTIANLFGVSREIRRYHKKASVKISKVAADPVAPGLSGKANGRANKPKAAKPKPRTSKATTAAANPGIVTRRPRRKATAAAAATQESMF